MDIIVNQIIKRKDSMCYNFLETSAYLTLVVIIRGPSTTSAFVMIISTCLLMISPDCSVFWEGF